MRFEKIWPSFDEFGDWVWASEFWNSMNTNKTWLNSLSCRRLCQPLSFQHKNSTRAPGRDRRKPQKREANLGKQGDQLQMAAGRPRNRSFKTTWASGGKKFQLSTGKKMCKAVQKRNDFSARYKCKNRLRIVNFYEQICQLRVKGCLMKETTSLVTGPS